MGTLHSTTNHTGIEINSITLGEPIETDNGYAWDDSRLPDGQLDTDGNLVEVAVEG
jgi:hypothetical protein